MSETWKHFACSHMANEVGSKSTTLANLATHQDVSLHGAKYNSKGNSKIHHYIHNCVTNSQRNKLSNTLVVLDLTKPFQAVVG